MSTKLVHLNQNSRKEKIITTSLEMFNDLGVENTTTRHIAKEMGISQGNLHYHYPNKNAILEKLYEDMMQRLIEAQQFSGQSLEADQMLESMLSNFRIMHQYRLFFQQNDVIWRRIPGIKEKMLQLFQVKKAEILELIAAFKKDHKLRKEVNATQIETLAEQLIFFIQSWLVVQHYQAQEQSSDYYARFLFRLWLPYLSEKELAKWQEMLDQDESSAMAK